MKSNHVIKVRCKLLDQNKIACVKCVLKFKLIDNIFNCDNFKVDWATYLTNTEYLTFLKDNWEE
jgi:hypothetical protein